MIYTTQAEQKAGKLENNPIYYIQEGEYPVDEYC